MLHLITQYKLHFSLLIEQESIVKALSISVAFFLILLVLGLRKSYKLRQENDRLSKLDFHNSEEESKVYKDFTEGHMYDNN